MGFRYVRKSVTTNGILAVCFCIISLNLVTFGACYVKMVEDTPIHSGSEM